MNQSELYAEFGDFISKSAIQKVDDEWRIVGKWCYITPDGGDMWDVWICNPKDLRKGLGTRKVNNIIRGLKLPVETALVELNGEAYAKVLGKGVILCSLDLLGIRKKRQLSQKYREKLANRMRALK